MKNSILFLLGFVLLVSCSEQEARRPVTQKTTTILKSTVEQNKKLIELENAMIETYLAKDSLHQYTTSSNGFWYTYITKKSEEETKPSFGDEVEIYYNLTDLNNTVFYSKEELGIKKYKIDKEDFIPALQDGLKLMKVGETITFVIPSYRAFGLVGDGNKIGINQPLKSTVTLIKINKN